MTNHIIKILKSVKESAGIDAVMFGADGSVLFRTAQMPRNDFSFSPTQSDIYQPEGEGITVLPLSGGINVILLGSGDEFRTYAAIIRAGILGIGENKKELTSTDKLRLYLSGELDAERETELLNKYSGAFDGYVLTLITDSAHKLGELKNFLETMREKGDLIVPFSNTGVAFIKHCGEDDEYQSATDFAFTLYDSIKEELRINVTVNVGGTVHAFADLPSFYDRCVLAYTFGQMLTPSDRIYSYKEYIMIKMLSDIPMESLTKYLDTLIDRDGAEILDDSELMTTAEQFLKNSLNISETSRNMYMHRNTLIYRLDKIEKATGLNLRHFNDAVAFRLLTVLSKLVNTHTDEEREKRK